MFVLEALPALIAGLLTWRFLPDRPADVDWLSNAEKQVVLADLAEDAGTTTQHMSVKQFLSDKRLWLLTAVYFCVVMGQYAMTFWLPTIVKNAGATTPLLNGMLTSLPFLTAMAAMLFFSFSADRTRERRWHLIIPMVVGALALTLASFFPHNLAISIVLLSIATAGMLTSTVMFWSLPPAFLGGVWAAAGIGAINSIGNVAGFVSPYVIGSLVSVAGDLRLGLYAIAGSVLLGATLVLLVPKSVNR